MYSFIQKFKFFPTDFAIDPLFMEIFADDLSGKYGGTNVEIFIGWLKAKEWPNYTDYYKGSVGYGSGSGNGRSGEGNSISNGASCGSGGGNGSGSGSYKTTIYNNLYLSPRLRDHFGFGEGNGSGDGRGRGKALGHGTGNGNFRPCRDLFNGTAYIVNQNLSIFNELDFEIQLEKGQHVFSLDSHGGCIFGQYLQHNGREVWLFNTRHFWSWNNKSIVQIASRGIEGAEIRIGAFNSTPLLLLVCNALLKVSEQHVSTIYNLPVDHGKPLIQDLFYMEQLENPFTD